MARSFMLLLLLLAAAAAVVSCADTCPVTKEPAELGVGECFLLSVVAFALRAGALVDGGTFSRLCLRVSTMHGICVARWRP
jgi:hypothetical protein